MFDSQERVIFTPKKGINIYKRKDGRWEARYVKEIGIDGKKKYGSVYADSYRAVKDKQQKILLIPAQDVKCPTNIKLTELMAKWLGHVQCRVKPATFCKYEGLSRNHILPELGDIRLTMITRATVEAFAQKQLKGGSPDGSALSAKTVNDILVVLGLAFEFAEEEYSVTMPKTRFLREEKKEARVLSRDEQQRLTNFLLSDMDIDKFGILLALYTGIRVGELCALQWEDVTDDFVCITKTLQRLKGPDGGTEIVIGEPKSESSRRIIPLPQFLVPYVSRFRQKNGYVMYTSKRTHTEPRTIQLKFQRMTDACGIGDVNFHALRHTFATRCIEEGVDVKSLSEILGHSDVKITLNRYVHSSFELKQKNIAKLSLPLCM